MISSGKTMLLRDCSLQNEISEIKIVFVGKASRGCLLSTKQNINKQRYDDMRPLELNNVLEILPSRYTRNAPGSSLSWRVLRSFVLKLNYYGSINFSCLDNYTIGQGNPSRSKSPTHWNQELCGLEQKKIMPASWCKQANYRQDLFR